VAGPDGGARDRHAVIPAPFAYVVAGGVDHAVELLEGSVGPGRLLAGGQSLLPMMKNRQVAPALLVDIGRLADLAGIRVDGDDLVVGATTTHAALAASPMVRRDAPLLAHVIGDVGDPQVRHRGTIGGALGQADPASDVLAALLAVGGWVELTGRAGDRRVAIDRFCADHRRGDGRTAELITAVRVPRAPHSPWAYQKLCRRTNEPSIVAVAVAGERVALANMGRTPLRAVAVEHAVATGLDDAAVLADVGTDPADDVYADSEYRRHLARTLTRRALADARSIT
jgi:aerobic carbon-monoxide dehydrogenase medium subunit